MISVCMCAYNGEKTINRQIDSILDQTLLPDEIVIYDDASTDSTVSIINEYIKSYPNIHWVLQIRSQNAGWRKNFHDAINLCTGDYIFTCDQDDYWYPYKVEEMISIMRGNSHILLLSSNYYLEKNGKLSKRKGQRYNNKVCHISYRSKKSVASFNPGCTYCFRKCLISDFDSFWADGMSHDRALWVVAAMDNGLYLYNKPCIKWVRTGFTASAINASHFSKERFAIKISGNRTDNLVATNLVRLALEKKDKKAELYYKRYVKKVLLQKSFYDKPTVAKATKLLFEMHWYREFKSYLQDMIAFKYRRKKKGN